MVLSPRASYLTFTDKRKTEGYSICHSCKYHLSSDEVLPFAIANNNMVGVAPECLTNRNIAECLQHHFGVPILFITISPDDENSWIIQVWCGEQIDHNICFGSDDNLRQKLKEWIALRIEFPRICALFFEDVLQVIIKELISWDEKMKHQEKVIKDFSGFPLHLQCLMRSNLDALFTYTFCYG